MKYITKYKSPNYNSRRNSKIKLIIIHYTALKNNKDAILHLCDKEKKVSSHYLISQNGTIYALVDDKFRAWHAGKSFWNNITNINSISIGIELDYNPFGKNNKFTYKMMSSLKKLLTKLQKNYKINKSSVLGHSDIAPFRKQDPGKNFPWKSLLSSKSVLKFKVNKMRFFSYYKKKSNFLKYGEGIYPKFKKDLDEKDVNKIALNVSKASKNIKNSKILKTIYVKNRIINYIIKS